MGAKTARVPGPTVVPSINPAMDFAGGAGTGGSHGGGGWPGAEAAAMTLPEFTEAISTGLRGHLVGEQVP
jgi:hypothetical protein